MKKHYPTTTPPTLPQHLIQLRNEIISNFITNPDFRQYMVIHLSHILLPWQIPPTSTHNKTSPRIQPKKRVSNKTSKQDQDYTLKPYYVRYNMLFEPVAYCPRTSTSSHAQHATHGDLQSQAHVDWILTQLATPLSPTLPRPVPFQLLDSKAHLYRPTSLDYYKPPKPRPQTHANSVAELKYFPDTDTDTDTDTDDLNLE